MLTIASTADYLPAINDSGVVLDEHERRQIIVKAAIDTVSIVDGVIDFDAEAPLIDQICYLEAPTAILGSLDASYLSLPEAVLATVRFLVREPIR